MASRIKRITAEINGSPTGEGFRLNRLSRLIRVKAPIRPDRTSSDKVPVPKPSSLRKVARAAGRMMSPVVLPGFSSSQPNPVNLIRHGLEDCDKLTSRCHKCFELQTNLIRHSPSGCATFSTGEGFSTAKRMHSV